ncbi:hypothetical protein A2215_02345 [Candidatus Berkelbacteria bacterium RIFOXYA2_FULL_43_10]|uniref:Uncharacterized protein n=1 Tax=Candidatus Berkelbacteria bacterium RIFOXYA2_FULL_43_10 TaxID=1797472 RepID=A0A1F5E5Q8_9BACT|nr:MAG: hypothetical protein A2215_02345 [Candidatus Berkelbacteria bacterium RIFOXYA2_FULL_43_10]
MKKEFRRSAFGTILASIGAGLAYVSAQDYFLVGADSASGGENTVAIAAVTIAGLLVLCVGAFFLVLAFTDL